MDTQQGKEEDSGGSEIEGSVIENGPNGPVILVDLGKRTSEDLVGLLLLEAERSAEAEQNMGNIRHELYARAERGTPINVHRSDILGGELGTVVTVRKKQRKGALAYDAGQVIRMLKGGELDALTRLERILDRGAFETQYRSDAAMREALGRFVQETPPKEWVELSGVSDWLKLRGFQ